MTIPAEGALGLPFLKWQLRSTLVLKENWMFVCQSDLSGELTRLDIPADSSPPTCGSAGWPWWKQYSADPAIISKSITQILQRIQKAPETPHTSGWVYTKCVQKKTRIVVLPSRCRWWSRAPDAAVWPACLCRGAKHAETSTPALKSKNARQAWWRGWGRSGEGALLEGTRRCRGEVSYFLTSGIFSRSFRTPCSWMLWMWWYLGKLPSLQRTITEDSKKYARLCSSVISRPKQSVTVSSQHTFMFLGGKKKKNTVPK